MKYLSTYATLTILCIIFCFSCNIKAQTLLPCQRQIIFDWLRCDGTPGTLQHVDFKLWAITANSDFCHVYIPTIADANVVAETWVNGVKE